MTENFKISIIIPVKSFNVNLKESLEHCLKLDYNDFEIIVLPDENIVLDMPKVKVVPTGNVTAPKKRDRALDYAQGEILAFIDDDAYPSADWLKNAIAYFDDPDIAVVCGPAVTPATDTFRQKASGLVYALPLVSGKFTYRYKPAKTRFVDDYPSCNFLIRKSVFKELGGFKTNFWPGEDTVLCLEITKNLGKKILYAPNILVYHHRRPLFLKHLRQIANYALHRGYFVKRFPQTSFRLAYFVPSIFIAWIISSAILSIILPALRPILLAVILTYLASVLIASLNYNFKLIPLVFLGIIESHLVYGWFFLKGLLSVRLREEIQSQM